MSIAEVARRVVETLGRPPRAFITDVDGTISSIAPTPDQARVDPDCRRHLAELARRLELVAVISGRAAANVRAMVGIDELLYVGNHGLEVWRAGHIEAAPAARPYVGAIAAALDHIAVATAHIEGLLYENKGVTASVHYRLAIDPGAARQAVLDAFAAAAPGQGLRLTEGRMVLELRPPVEANKGTAVEMLVAEYGLRGAVFAGDDTTDVDAFRALRRLAQGGRLSALSIGVLAEETPSVVREEADVLVPGVAGVGHLLKELASYWALPDRADR